MGTILSTAAALLALGAAACGPDDPDTAAPVNGLGAASTETKTLASGTKNEVVGVAVRGVEDPRAFVVEEYAAIARDPSADRDRPSPIATGCARCSRPIRPGRRRRMA